MSDLLFQIDEPAQIKVFLGALDTVGKIIKKVVPTIEDDEKKKTAPDVLIYSSTALIPSRLAYFPSYVIFDFVSYLTKRTNRVIGDLVKENDIQFSFGFNYGRHRAWIKNNSSNIKQISVYDDKIVLAIVPGRIQTTLSYTMDELVEYSELSDKVTTLFSNDDNPPLIFIEGFQQDIVKKAPSAAPIFFEFDVETQSVVVKTEIYEVDASKPCLRVLKSMLFIPEDTGKCSLDIALYRDLESDNALYAVFMAKAKDYESIQYCKFASKV